MYTEPEKVGVYMRIHSNASTYNMTYVLALKPCGWKRSTDNAIYTEDSVIHPPPPPKQKWVATAKLNMTTSYRLDGT